MARTTRKTATQVAQQPAAPAQSATSAEAAVTMAATPPAAPHATSTQDATRLAGLAAVEGAGKLEALRKKHAEANAALNPATRYRPIDHIRAAFSNAKRPIEIPEWGHPESGEPLVLYFEPLTLADLEWVAVGAPENETLHARNVRLLVYKAKVQDAEGHYKPAFVAGDASILMREAFYSVVQRVTHAMYEVNVTPTEAEEALEDPQTAGSASTSTM